MAVRKPAKIANDPTRAALWNQLTKGANLTRKDAPALSLLCLWYAIAAEAEAAITSDDGRLEVLDPIALKPFKDEDGEAIPMYRKAPALAVLKEASVEIRALTEQLGISSKKQSEPNKKTSTPNGQLLNLVFMDREDKAKKAVNL